MKPHASIVRTGRRAGSTWAIGWALFVTAGCGIAGGPGGAKPSSESGQEESAAEAQSLKTVSAASLPPLGEYLPPLDEGRIEVAPPEGWKRLKPTAEYLAQFVKADPPPAAPQILIDAQQKKLGEMETATVENVEEFARLAAAELKGLKLVEPVRPMIIGEHPYVRFVRLRTFPSGPPLERQILQTLVRGRLYSIDLQVAQGEILVHRDAAYAVAAGVKFPQAAETKAATIPTESKPPP